jgi:hypothetical protein
MHFQPMLSLTTNGFLNVNFETICGEINCVRECMLQGHIDSMGYFDSNRTNLTYFLKWEVVLHWLEMHVIVM